MPDEKVTTLEALTKRGQTVSRELGEPEPEPVPSDLEDMDDDAIRGFLQKRGWEMRKTRSAYGLMSKADDVANKRRLSVYLTAQLRRDIQFAGTIHDMKLSAIAEEAFREWLDKRGLGQPGQ